MSTQEIPLRQQGKLDSPFKPTLAMVRYVEAVMAKDVPPDEEARCKAAGASIRSLGRWRSDVRFTDWLSAEIQRRLAKDVWKIWVLVGRLAQEGNLQAAKLYLARFDPEAAGLATTEPEQFYMLAELAVQAVANADRGPPTADRGRKMDDETRAPLPSAVCRLPS